MIILFGTFLWGGGGTGFKSIMSFDSNSLRECQCLSNNMLSWKEKGKQICNFVWVFSVQWHLEFKVVDIENLHFLPSSLSPFSLSQADNPFVAFNYFLCSEVKKDFGFGILKHWPFFQIRELSGSGLREMLVDV